MLAELIFTEVTDSLALLCATDHKVHKECRKLIQPDLKDSYKELAKKDSPVAVGQLFGTDLAKQVKDLDESQKVRTTLTKQTTKDFTTSRNIFKGQGRGANRGNRGHFLGQRQPVYNLSRRPTNKQPYRGRHPQGQKNCVNQRN